MSTTPQPSDEDRDRPTTAEEWVKKYDRDLLEEIAADGSAAAAEALKMAEESDDE